MQVKNIAEWSKGSILQYFGPSLSYYLSFRSLFCLFLGCHLRQVLLYLYDQGIMFVKNCLPNHVLVHKDLLLS